MAWIVNILVHVTNFESQLLYETLLLAIRYFPSNKLSLITLVACSKYPWVRKENVCKSQQKIDIKRN